jgi:hypothetical protein
VNRDLFLAILSMDSYNRGYGTHIAGLKSRGERVGSALISDESLISGFNLEQVTGFYAINYIAGAGIEGVTVGTTIVKYGDMMRIKSIDTHIQ